MSEKVLESSSKREALRVKQNIGFRSSLYHPSSIDFLRHPNQKQPQVQTPPLSGRRQIYRGTLRLNYCPSLEGWYFHKTYPEKLRRNRFFDTDLNKRLVFLNNKFTLRVSRTIQLFQWGSQIEIFFK